MIDRFKIEIEDTALENQDEENLDYNNFDDYPSDLPLDFEEHPYIRDELGDNRAPTEPQDTLNIRGEG
jgi:hypothetical protein